MKNKVLEEARKKLPAIVQSLFKVKVILQEEEYELDVFSDLFISDPFKEMKDAPSKYFFIAELANMAEQEVDKIKAELEKYKAEKDRELRIAGVRGETRINREIFRDPRYMKKIDKLSRTKRKHETLKTYTKALEMQVSIMQSLVKSTVFHKAELRNAVREIMEENE